MALRTITRADLGQIILQNGFLQDVLFTKAPDTLGAYFTLLDISAAHPRQLFNGDVSTMFIPTGTHLLQNGSLPYDELTVWSIPVGAEFQITYDDVGVPTLTELVPNTVVSGGADFTLYCFGTNFTADTVIQFGGSDEPTVFISSTEISTIVKPSLFAPATVPVLVKNGAISSAPMNFIFTEAAVEPPGPPPVLDSLNPVQAVVGSSDVIVRCVGSGFIAVATKINFNGIDVTTGFTNSTEIFCLVRPVDYSASVVEVYVHDDNGSSATLPFTFVDP
jgi:hypothetical protein